MEVFWLPKSFQNPAWLRLGGRFGCSWGHDVPKMRPRCPITQKGPKWNQLGSKMLPKCVENAPNMLPKCFQDASKMRPRSVGPLGRCDLEPVMVKTEKQDCCSISLFTKSRSMSSNKYKTWSQNGAKTEATL